MHFWIDKRSQACSLSGRYRAPSGVASSRHRGVLWGGTGTGCCKVGGGGLVMVTPVHRFQPIESAQSGCGVRRSHHHRQRLLAAQQGTSLLQPHASASRLQPSETSSENGHHHEGFEHIGRGGGGMSLLPQGSSPGLASQQQVLLRLPAPRHETLAVGKIKCGLWASLALILSFMAASSGWAVLVLYIVVCVVLLVLLVVGCVLSLCSTGSSRGCLATRSTRASSQNQNTPGPRSALIEVPEEEEAATESLMLAQHTQPWIQQQQQRQSSSPQRQVSQQTPSSTVGEPPPYHIAIWLPQPEPPLHIIPPVQQEVPPPSYDKATS
ncbi:hypothetical protein B566_EDAN007918 [Ephemera danica]|nr:hypothetical protein B566_EDAN007918 [Ephemera danica]